ncbi:MAG: hypothetical protein ABI232_00275 [Jatrophihabitantaceae bacterium]
MTTGTTPEADGPEPGPRLENGLQAAGYVPLTDIDQMIGRHLLAALGRARIAAYLEDSPMIGEPRQRLFVAQDERADARTIVAAVLRATGEDDAARAVPEHVTRPDPLVNVDTDAAFADLIADWHVDTISAIRDAERSLSREDADWRARLEQSAAEPVWLDDHHYVPPPPPPLPRLAAPTIIAMSVLAISILLLGLGGQFGLASQLTLLLGVGGVILGAAMLVMRLRDHPDDEDGAVL